MRAASSKGTRSTNRPASVGCRGDFSVRLPDDLPGTDGEIASIFNEVVAMEEAMTAEYERLSRVVGKEGKITQRGHVRGRPGEEGRGEEAVAEPRLR